MSWNRLRFGDKIFTVMRYDDALLATGISERPFVRSSSTEHVVAALNVMATSGERCYERAAARTLVKQ
jgi:hypothetical protein